MHERKMCGTCGKEFIPKDHRQTRCSPECRLRNRTANEAAKYREERRKEAKQSRECALCAKKYRPVSRTKPGLRLSRSVYCSDYCARRAGRVTQYGLSVAQFKELARYRKCNICQKKISLRQMHVEHSHETNEVYGITCPSCNYALAYIKRDPLTAFAMIDYLTNPPARMLDGVPKFLTEAWQTRLKQRSFRKPRYRRIKNV